MRRQSGPDAPAEQVEIAGGFLVQARSWTIHKNQDLHIDYYLMHGEDCLHHRRLNLADEEACEKAAQVAADRWERRRKDLPTLAPALVRDALDALADQIDRLAHAEADEEDAEVYLLAEEPALLERPLQIVGDYAYAAGWPSVNTGERVLLVLRDDGQAYCDGRLDGVKPLADLGARCALTRELAPRASHTWSGAGVARYQQGERSDPASIYTRLARVVDQFVDFSFCFAPHPLLVALVTCYIMATYFLDAFNAFGYLYFTGHPTSGKSQALKVIAQCSYLGRFLLPTSSVPTIRDEAGWGATLCFDEAENLTTRQADPALKSIMLGGYQRGLVVQLKEQIADRLWATKDVHLYCPQLYGSVARPTGAYAERSILVRLTLSLRPESPPDPFDLDAWPHDRQALLDDLWSMGLSELVAIRRLARTVAPQVPLSMRDRQVWLPPLVVAWWLQHSHDVRVRQGGRSVPLYDALIEVVGKAQEARVVLEYDSAKRLAMQALMDLVEERSRANGAASDVLTISSADLAGRVNALAIALDLASPTEPFTTALKVGMDLAGWGMFVRPEKRDRKAKGWRIQLAHLYALACAMHPEWPKSVPVPPPMPDDAPPDESEPEPADAAERRPPDEPDDEAEFWTPLAREGSDP
jgi:hypothetical protein